MVDLSKQRLNYDTIAHLYDEPIRDYDVDPNLVDYLSRQASSDQPIWVLDLGCGTGKQLTADSKGLNNVRLIGLDLFSGMLRIAQKRGPGVSWVKGDNANPPFASGSLDYITNQFNYQHVQQQEKMFQILGRLLKPSGRLVMNNIDPWYMPGWLIYHFFPAAWELDTADFLPVETIVGLLETAGFINIEVSRRTQVTDTTLGEVYDYCSRRAATSQFMAISDDAYATGLRRLENEIKALGKSAVFQSTLCFLTIIAEKQ
jgi:ubiquinone/menaquinone biosynthesis C-methylase UbiE